MHLHHDIQDLIDNKTIKAPKPIVQANPLTTHINQANVDHISLAKSSIYDPNIYITPLTQPKPQLTFPKEDECCMIEVHSDSGKSEVLDPMVSSDDEGEEDEKLKKWKEHS